MDAPRHMIRCILNPRFLSEITSYDTASTIRQNLPSNKPKTEKCTDAVPPLLTAAVHSTS